MKSVYFAGPDVFRPDYQEHLVLVRGLCREAGIQPLLPGDVVLSDSKEIFNHNISLIRQADGIIANLNPFRSPVEPDSGTVFECAFAYALNKPVIGIIADGSEMLAKLNKAGLGPAVAGGADSYGFQVENFGHPLNLMLIHGLAALCGSLEEAIKAWTGLRY